LKSKLLIEQHFHGAFGVDFNKASVDDVLYLAHEIRKIGVGGIFPTLVTDSIENIKRQTVVIKEAAQRQTSDTAKILGIHLEGIFLNPVKKGIHDEKLFLPVSKYHLVADDFMKIVTCAPELGLPDANAKIQAGHCVSGDLSKCNGITHLFNAMEGISHRTSSTALSALLDDIYVEVIADGIHLSDDILRLVFKVKRKDKIILISDSLPIAKSSLEKMTFAGSDISKDGKSPDGTLAGSVLMLPDIIKKLAQKNMFDVQFIENPYNYHKLDLPGEIEWDEEFNIIKC
jgi:N-acetylglucosamine-6-phosphate deacetylase